MTALRRLIICIAAAGAALLLAGWPAAAAGGPGIHAGTYHGRIHCAGSDRFSSTAPTLRYRSRPRVTVGFGSRQRLRRWTYLFLGRRNLRIQSHAVLAGQNFSYAAGSHIGRPGRTVVTVTDLTRSRGAVLLLAQLDWSSPATGYIGAGTYTLMLERLSDSRIRYEAVKVVVKQPVGAPSAANPIVRRHEVCVGQLVR